MTARRYVSVMINRDGALKGTSYHLPMWLLRALLIVGIVLTVVLVLAVAYYAPIARQAARVPGLEREVERLTRDNARVRELAQALDSVEARFSKLRSLVGADIMPDPVQLGAPIPVAPSIVVLPRELRPTYLAGPSDPRYWPLDERGYLTRGYLPEAGSDQHPGLDVAVPVGAVVRASGGGTVLQAAEDAEYGLFALIQHPDGYQTMYGHLSRLTTREGDRVRAGAVIGRSGNTGRSTAPHLHFEIRHNGVSIDPLTLVKEEP